MRKTIKLNSPDCSRIQIAALLEEEEEEKEEIESNSTAAFPFS